ncbi:class I SAM-dependent methyltransferase [Spirillospora sp. CA-253888]
MPQPATTIRETGTIAPHLRRLLDFVEPVPEDVCLDVARGTGPMPAALGPQVRHVAAVDALPPAQRRDGGRSATVTFGTGPVRITTDVDLPQASSRPFRPVPRRGCPDTPTVRAEATRLPYRDDSFSLVTTRFSLYHMGDPDRVLRELLRVCRPGGRLIIADLVRSNLSGPDRDRLERLRDPDHPGTPSIAALTDLVTSAGASIRRLDVFTVERPIEPWLAGARDRRAADQIRAELIDEVDGGPRTGAKPRVIGGELWFTQSWAHVAAEPI